MIKKFENISVENIGLIEGHNGAIYDAIFSDGFLLTTSADKFVAQWDVHAQKQTNFAVKLDNAAYNIAYSPGTKILAVGTNDGGIHVIDVEKREEVRLLVQHKSSVFSLTHNPYKNHFYSGDREGYFCVWDDKNFDLLLTYPFDCDKIREIAMNEDGEYIAVCGQDGYIRIFETEYFNQVAEFKTHDGGVNCALFAKDVLYTGGKDAHIRNWNWREGKMIMEVPAHNYAVYDLEFLEKGSKMVSVSFDKTIKIWNSKDISIIERIEFQDGGHRHTVNRIAKINEESFVTVGDDRKIKIWKLRK